MNTLYYGDNLDVLKQHIATESVDLVYLDPPFNSQATYNVLFAERDGSRAAAQIEAFDDTWRWDQAAVYDFERTIEAGGSVADALMAMRTLLGGSDMLAYLSMMAPRLVELHRVLKPTGSLYLHCDPTASHYLKLILDAVFGAQHFRSEIIWKRTSGHSDARGFGHAHDVILYVVKSNEGTWNQLYQEYDPAYVEQYYRYKDDDGRRFMSGDASAAGLSGGGYVYEWKGVTREWRHPIETMQRLDDEGRLFYTRNGIPRVKRYLDEAKGMPAQDVWTDIEALRSWHRERLGYPTQKPVALLERIVSASSNEGDLVLDPFCGCGTAVDAAQRLGRQWIGIDITHLAINLIKHRLRDTFGDDAQFSVVGEPVNLSGAQELASSDPYQFQWWALGLVGARPVEQKKGADRGIDGRLFFHDEQGGQTKQVILSVKAGHVHRAHIHELRGVIEREKAAIGVFLSMESPTRPMKEEAASAGLYEAPWGQKYPRLQLLTIADLLDGRTIDMPPVGSMALNVTHKKAPKAASKKGKAPAAPSEPDPSLLDHLEDDA